MVPRGTQRFADLRDFCGNSGLRKQHIARVLLEIEPWELSHLLNPSKYQPRVDDSLVERIAALINQKPEYVRRLYPKAA